MRWIWLVFVLPWLLAVAEAPGPPTDAERVSLYKEFRTRFDAHQYSEALPFAQQLVTMTEQQYSPTALALVNPLCNLATAQYRLHDYDGALQNYRRSVDIVVAASGDTDRQLLRPLAGLGSTYLATKQYADAALTLKHGVDLSRNLDGLFNVAQLELLEPLIASYTALQQKDEAEKERQYTLRIAENEYGKDDRRMLGPLDSYARWLESIDRYDSARAVHLRALAIAQKAEGKESALGVPAMQGIARTYRLEFLNGQDAIRDSDDPFAGSGGGNSGLKTDASNSQRLNPDGERMLHQALEILDKAQPVDHGRRGATLIELGDWNLTAGASVTAMENYRNAWKELAAAGGTGSLEKPYLIAYKGPASSARRSHRDPENAQQRHVELSFTVRRDGHTAEIATTSSDAPDVLQKAVVSSVQKARYRPRFENGEAVETKGVTLREQLLLRKPKSNS